MSREAPPRFAAVTATRYRTTARLRAVGKFAAQRSRRRASREPRRGTKPMGGASDSPLETAGDRNGLVSGGKPWNRGVLQSGAERAVRQRTTSEAPSALERMRDGVDRLAGPTRLRHAAFFGLLPHTSVRSRSATATQRRLRTEQAGSARHTRPVRRSKHRHRSTRSLRSPTAAIDVAEIRFGESNHHRRKATDLRHRRRTSVPR